MENAIRLSDFLEYLSEDIMIRLLNDEGKILFTGVKRDITHKLEDRMIVAFGSVIMKEGCLEIKTIHSDMPSIPNIMIDPAVENNSCIEELTKRLNDVPHSYYDFVAGITTYCRKKPQRLEKVIKYMTSHPEADTSDIIEFVSKQEDFYEDTVR